MITESEIVEIVDAVTYKPGWFIHLGKDKERFYIQVHGRTQDTQYPHRKTEWKGGKRYLSPYMCRQEIVGICFDAIKAAEDHETREWFRYLGASIFNPHLDPDKLALFALRRENFCIREDAMSMAENEKEKEKTDGSQT